MSAGRLSPDSESGFGSAILYRSVAQSSERLAWDQEVAGGNPAIPTNLRSLSFGSAGHFQVAAVVENIRHPPSERKHAGENPAGSANAIARSDNSSPSGCYPDCAGAIPARAANLNEPSKPQKTVSK